MSMTLIDEYDTETRNGISCQRTNAVAGGGGNQVQCMGSDKESVDVGLVPPKLPCCRPMLVVTITTTK